MVQCAGNRLLRSATRWRHYNGRQAAFRRELLEGGQIAALQILPTPNQFSALPLQLLKLLLFGFGWRGISGADIHREVGQLRIELRRIGQRVFIRADGQVDKLFADGDEFLLQIIRSARQSSLYSRFPASRRFSPDNCDRTSWIWFTAS